MKVHETIRASKHDFLTELANTNNVVTKTENQTGENGAEQDSKTGTYLCFTQCLMLTVTLFPV